MRPVQAGKLRHRITINRPVPGSPNAFGERSLSWTLFGTFWASVEPVSGEETPVAQTFVADVSHKISMRYVAGILPTFQVIYAGRIFNLKTILNIEERQRLLVLLCNEQIRT